MFFLKYNFKYFLFSSSVFILYNLSVEVNKIRVELLISEIQEVVLSRLAYRHNLGGGYKVTTSLGIFHLLKSNPVIDKDLLSQKRLQLCGEELGEGADVVEHLQQVLQPLAEALKDAKDVLLAEVELAHLALHLPVSRLDVSTPRWQVSQRKIFKVFISNQEKWKPVVVFQLDAMSQLLLNSLHVLIPDRVLVVRKYGIFLL